ncbi:MAG TPA: hypothetical protein VI423_08705 [Paenisporosarcina sp.]|nr:hypothetical protein [Paenisporosarcina sp.]
MNNQYPKIGNLFRPIDSLITNASNRLNPKTLVISVIVLPLLIAFILPILFWGKLIFDFLPNSSDEVTYWREINTFVNYGFNGGQYSNDELIARFDGSHFGTHGPAFAVSYGLLGKVIGWDGYTPVLINISLIFLAMIVVIKLVNPDNKQLLILLVLFVTWWPLQLYIPSNMQETLHSSAAIVLAAFFYQFFTDRRRKLTYFIYISVILVFLVAFRYIWGFLLFPAILFFPRRPNLKSWTWATIGTALLLMTGAWFVLAFYSPSPWFWTTLIQTFMSSTKAGLIEFAQHFVESLNSFFIWGTSISLVALVRYQVLGLIIVWMIWQIRHIKNREIDRAYESREHWFHIFNLSSVLIFVLFFYDVLDTRDYRMLIGPLLLSAVMMVLSRKLIYVYPLIVVNIIFTVAFVTYYVPYRYSNFNYDPRVLEETSKSINSNIYFEPSLNRWCNTIAVSKYGRFNAFSYSITTIHSGFGTTTVLDWKEFLDRPLQSRYVILDPEYSLPGLPSPVNRFDLIEIALTPLGTLLLNPYSSCND